jgi:hypothetical protein
VDFATTPIEAIFVIHDDGLDWALATQVITEILNSDGGRLGTQRKRDWGVEDGGIPLVLTNPDFIWGTCVPLSPTIDRYNLAMYRLAA